MYCGVYASDVPALEWSRRTVVDAIPAEWLAPRQMFALQDA
jgi:hypothetical protein